MTQPSPWHSDYPLSLMNVQNILTMQFPALCPISVELLGEGWDNTTWLVNQQWCFRFPKHQRAARLIQNELCLLPDLQHLPVKVPMPVFIGQSSELFPYLFYGHQFLTGSTADRCRLNDKARINLARPLGFFLKTLHTFPLTKALAMGIEYDQHKRMDVSLQFEKFQERLTYLVEQRILSTCEPWLRFFRQWQSLKTPELWVLGHGDFYARHLILAQENRLTAVIDWGDTEILHPAVDLAIAYQFIPPSAQEEFWHSYGAVSELTQLLAKLRALYSSVTSAWYAHQTQDELLMQEGLQGLYFMATMLA